MKYRSLSKVLVITLGTILLIFNVASVYAQTAGGTILGRVTDLTGAVIPGAAITIKNTETGIMRSVLTGETGVYNAANLQPGTYLVTAEMPSFSTGMKK